MEPLVAYFNREDSNEKVNTVSPSNLSIINFGSSIDDSKRNKKHNEEILVEWIKSNLKRAIFKWDRVCRSRQGEGKWKLDP